MIGLATTPPSEVVQSLMSSYQNVKVNVEQITPAQLNVIAFQGNFDMLPSAIGGADPSNVFDQNFQTGAGRNFTKYSNPTFDAALAEGRSTSDQKERAKAYGKAQAQLIKDSYPWIMPIATWSNSFWVVNNKSIQGFNSGSWMGADTSQLWLKTKK